MSLTNSIKLLLIRWANKRTRLLNRKENLSSFLSQTDFENDDEVFPQEFSKRTFLNGQLFKKNNLFLFRQDLGQFGITKSLARLLKRSFQENHFHSIEKEKRSLFSENN